MATQTEQIDNLIQATTDLKQTFEGKRDEIDAATQANTDAANQAVTDLTNARTAFDNDAAAIADKNRRPILTPQLLRQPTPPRKRDLRVFKLGGLGNSCLQTLFRTPICGVIQRLMERKFQHMGLGQVLVALPKRSFCTLGGMVRAGLWGIVPLEQI